MELLSLDREAVHLLIGDLPGDRVAASVQLQSALSPVCVLVPPIRLTTTSRLTSGLPLQFSVMWQNIRCSILFHLLVPGGKWHTEMLSPILVRPVAATTYRTRQQRLPQGHRRR